MEHNYDKKIIYFCNKQKNHYCRDSLFFNTVSLRAGDSTYLIYVF